MSEEELKLPPHITAPWWWVAAYLVFQFEDGEVDTCGPDQGILRGVLVAPVAGGCYRGEGGTKKECWRSITALER